MKVNMLFFIIFILLGLVMVFLSLLLNIHSNNKVKKCINVIKGEVIKYTLWNNNGVYFPIIQYIVNGVKYTQRLKYGWIVTKSSSFNKIKPEVKNDVNSENLVLSKNSHISTNALEKSFPIGTQLDVYYNPKNPKESYVMRFVKSPCIIVFLIVGIFFIILALIGLLLMPNNIV